MLYRAILSRWEIEAEGYDENDKPKSVGDFELDEEQIAHLNSLGYNIYFFPNHPSTPSGNFTQSADVDVFNSVFVDMDLKDGDYADKESFYAALSAYELPPTLVVDSGNGVHAYWGVSDLDAMSFLRLQRRLCRHFKTDHAVAKLNQLMRVPGTYNTKNPDRSQWKMCTAVELERQASRDYSCEELDRHTDKITIEDEEYCQRTYDSAFNPQKVSEAIRDLPDRWFKFATKGSEAYRLFYQTPLGKRSEAHYRLAHLMLADGFTREEALAVLANTDKASERASTHRHSYGETILGKMWREPDPEKPQGQLGYSIADLLGDDDEEFEGTPFRCNEMFDATECGFRLGHVLGLVGGPGSGKTAVSLNIFYHFVKNNPQYTHVIFSLEQPAKEVAKRWRKVTGENKAMYSNVVIVDNYNTDGTHRMLSLEDCEAYVKKLQDEGLVDGQMRPLQIGAVMIDHIGILKQDLGKKSEREALVEICQAMKGVAVNRNVMLIMQSQTSREKAKGGDVELGQDAAYGTNNFEWFVDWLITIWQPLRRVYHEVPEMTVTCFRYCKIRHKTPKDRLKQDTNYALMFDQGTERLRRMTIAEKEAYDFYAHRAATERNRDKSKDPGAVHDVTWVAERRRDDA